MNISRLQDEVAAFNKANQLEIDTHSRLLDLYSEMGELAKEMLKGSDYGNREAELPEEWADELGDCLYSLVSLANETEVDLQQQLERVLEKYGDRMEESGRAGSGE